MSILIKEIDIPNDNFVTVVAIYRNPKTERIYAEWTDEEGIHHGGKVVEVDENDISMLANAYLERENHDGNIYHGSI